MVTESAAVRPEWTAISPNRFSWSNSSPQSNRSPHRGNAGAKITLAISRVRFNNFHEWGDWDPPEAPGPNLDPARDLRQKWRLSLYSFVFKLVRPARMYPGLAV